MPFSVCYVATVDGEPVAHLGMGSMNKAGKAEARGCRLVVMPEWQGAGVGLRLLNGVCEMYAQGGGHGKLAGRPLTTMFHTSHPGLCAALRRDRRWRQVSAVMHGGHGGRNGSTLKVKSCDAHGVVSLRDRGAFGGHFRAIQGFRYYGQAAVDAARAS